MISNGAELQTNGSAPSREDVARECETSGILIPKNEIELEHLLGQGSFGSTYYGIYRGQRVAVKQVTVKSGGPGLQLFVRELTALRSANSPHVVKLYGVVMEPNGATWLVLDFLPGGTLRDWLYGDHHHWHLPSRRKAKHSFAEQLSMCLHIAQGMQDLEVLQPKIMHRDLKPTNILLSASGQPVISDFGLSRAYLESEAGTFTNETGSYTYMSPEMMKSQPYGPQTDVYSFAIIMAEVFACKEPFSDFKLTPVQTATFMADKGGRPNLPNISSDFPQQLKDLIEQCWDQDPNNRPTFATIATTLQNITCR